VTAGLAHARSFVETGGEAPGLGQGRGSLKSQAMTANAEYCVERGIPAIGFDPANCAKAAWELRIVPNK